MKTLHDYLVHRNTCGRNGNFTGGWSAITFVEDPAYWAIRDIHTVYDFVLWEIATEWLNEKHRSPKACMCDAIEACKEEAEMIADHFQTYTFANPTTLNRPYK